MTSSANPMDAVNTAPTNKELTFDRPYLSDEVDYIMLDDLCTEAGEFYEDNKDFIDDLAHVGKVKALTVKEKKTFIKQAIRTCKSHRSSGHISCIDLQVMSTLQSAISSAINAGRCTQAKRLRAWFGSLLSQYQNLVTPYILNFDTKFDDDIGMHTVDEYKSPLQKIIATL